MRATIVVSALAVLVSGCGKVTWVNDVTTSPNGQVVTVVGGEYNRFGQTVSEPLRWRCVRDNAGRLTCQPDPRELPKLDD